MAVPFPECGSIDDNFVGDDHAESEAGIDLFDIANIETLKAAIKSFDLVNQVGVPISILISWSVGDYAVGESQDVDNYQHRFIIKLPLYFSRFLKAVHCRNFRTGAKILFA